MNEGTNINSIKIEELTKKITVLLKSNEELTVNIISLKDNINSKNDELAKNNEEMNYYEDLLKLVPNEEIDLENEPSLASKIMEGTLNLKQNIIREENIYLVHEKLKGVVEEFDKFLLEEQMLNSDNKKIAETEPLVFQSVCVILVDGELLNMIGKPQLKYQTFKLFNTTSFKELKYSCFELWDLKERGKDFNLRFIDIETLYKIDNEEDLIIDSFLKTKSNIKKAKFVLVNIKKIKFEDIFENEENKSINKTNNNKQSYQKKANDFSKIIDNFLKQFVGLTLSMTKQIEKIEHDKITNIKVEEKVVNRWVIILNTCSNLVFFLFFVFTILSLISIRPTGQSYEMHNALINKYGSSNNGIYLKASSFIGDITERLSDMFFDPNLLKPPSIDFNAAVSPIRLSIYKTINRDCLGPIASLNYTCYDALFSSSSCDINLSSEYMANNTCKILK